MAATTSRTLELLSLLQSHRHWSARELVDRLGVSDRTLRRDVERLRELGYGIESMRGSAGGYRLEAGTGLPPLLLTDDEGVAIAVGPALAGDGRAARRRAHDAQRPRQDRAGAAARAAPPHRRAAVARDGRRRRARRRRAGRRPRSTPNCSACSRSAAATPSGCGSATRMPRASHPSRVDRALPARAGRPALVPARVGPAARRLAHVPARPHQRRVPDAGAVRAAADDRRGGARARGDRAALARPQRAGAGRGRRCRRPNSSEHLGWYGRDVVADGPAAACGRSRPTPSRTSSMALMWVPRGRRLPRRGAARGARVPRRAGRAVRRGRCAGSN